jgi:hypothetical protein
MLPAGRGVKEGDLALALRQQRVSARKAVHKNIGGVGTVACLSADARSVRCGVGLQNLVGFQ